MKNCIACNEQLEDGAKFCSNCRAEQPERQVEPQETTAAQEGTASVRCEKCGEELQEKWRACPFCLTPVLKPAEAPPVSALVLPHALEDTIALQSALISSDGKYIAIHCYDRLLGRDDPNNLKIMDANSGDIKKGGFHYSLYSPYAPTIRAVSVDGIHVVMIAEFSGRDLINVQTGKSIRLGMDVNSGPNAFSADGKRLAYSHNSGVGIFDIQKGKELFSIREQPKLLAYSPDSCYLAFYLPDQYGDDKRTVIIYDARNGDEFCRLDEKEKSIYSIAFNHDGTRIVTGASEGVGGIKIWDVKSGDLQLQLQLEEVFGYLSSARFSPDGKVVIVTSKLSGMVNLINAENGETLKQLNTGYDYLEWASYSSDGKKLITYDGGGGSGKLKFWVGE